MASAAAGTGLAFLPLLSVVSATNNTSRRREVFWKQLFYFFHIKTKLTALIKADGLLFANSPKGEGLSWMKCITSLVLKKSMCHCEFSGRHKPHVPYHYPNSNCAGGERLCLSPSC